MKQKYLLKVTLITLLIFTQQILFSQNGGRMKFGGLGGTTAVTRCESNPPDLEIFLFNITATSPYDIEYEEPDGDIVTLVDIPLAGDGSTSYSFSAIENGTYTLLTITDDTGANINVPGGHADVDVTLDPNPTLSITPDPAYASVGANLNLTGTPAGGTAPYAGYSWSGHASINGEITQTVTFNSGSAGGFPITCVVTDDNGCTGSDVLTVQVSNLSAAIGITPNPATICLGETVTLDGQPSGGSGSYTHSWSWSSAGTGTGSFSNAAIEDPPTFTPNHADTYTLTYTVTDAVTSAIASASVNVTVNPLPNTKTVVTTDYCAGAAGGSLTVQSCDLNTSYTLINNTTSTIISTQTAALAGDDLTWTNLTQADYYVQVTDQTTSCSVGLPLETITENPLPAVAPTIDDNPVCSGSTSTLRANSPTGVAWVWDNAASISGSNTVANPIASPLAFTNYTVTVTDGNGCQSTGSVSVNVTAQPTININDDQGNTFTICEQDDIILTGTSTKSIASWQWSSGDATPSTTVGPTTTTSYTLTVVDTDGCTNNKSQVVTVNDRPTANAGSDEVMCFGAGVTLTATATDGDGAYSYLWNTGDATANANVNPLNDATYTVTVTDGNGCNHADDVFVDVVSNPTVTADADAGFSTSICHGESTDLLATPGGGLAPYTYNWLPGGQSTDVITVSPPNATEDDPPFIQTYTVTLEDANECTATDNVDVTVFSLSSLTIDNDGQSYCQDAGLVTLTANRSNASSTWTSSTAGFITGGNQFDAGAHTDGTYDITYEYTNSNNCTNTVSGSVEILPYNTPTVSFTNPLNGDNFCNTGEPLVNITTSDDVGGEPNITRTITGPGVVTDNGDGTGQFDPNDGTGAGVGSHTLTYTVTTPGCNASASITVDVGNPVNITPLNDMCVGDADQPLAVDVGGGDWEITFTPDAGVPNTVTYPEGDPLAELQANEPGLYEVDYIYSAFSCTNTTTATCRVEGIPAVDFEIGAYNQNDNGINFCDNITPVDLIPTPGGGSFSSIPAGNVNSSTFEPAVVGAGTYEIVYSYTDGNGCSNSVTSKPVEVNAAPVVDITELPNTYCKDDADFTITGDPTSGNAGPGSFTFPGAWASGTQYTDNGDGTAEVSPQNINPTGTFNVTYEVDDLNGCVGSITEAFTVYELPTVNFTGLPVSGQICRNADPIELTGSPKNNNGSFNVLAGLTDNGDGTATFDPSALTPGTHTIRYTYTNPVTTCTNFIEKDIEVTAIPSAYSIVAPSGADYCEDGVGVQLGVTNSQNNTYTYELIRNGATVVASEPGISAAFNFAGTYTSGDYTVEATHPTTGCVQEFANTVTVNEIPAIDDAGTISGTANICADGATNYTYSVPAIANATDYVWTLPANVTLVADAGNSIDVTFSAAFAGGAIEVYGIDAGNTVCPDGDPSSITVNPRNKPVLVGAPAINGDNVVCEGETGATYSINTADINFETSYEWTTTTGNILTDPTASSVTVEFPAGTVSGTLQVRGVNACGESNWVTLNITVNPIPNVSVNALGAGDVITCDAASQVQLNAASTENPGDITGWLWTASNGGVIVPGDETVIDPFVTHEGDFEVQIEVTKNGLACYNTATTTVNPDKNPPAVTIDAPDEIDCNNTTVFLQANAVGVTYNWTFTPPANIVAGDETVANPEVTQPGTYTVQVTDLSNSCTNSASVTVTRDISTPDINVVDPAAQTLTCSQLTATLDGSSATTNKTFLWTGPNPITNPTFEDATVSDPGTYTLEVTNTDNGCTDTRTVEVLQDITSPTASITNVDAENADITCTNLEVDLQASADVPNATFVWGAGGGNIVSQGGLYNQNATVDATATYSVIATDPSNGCSSVASTLFVDENLATATATAINSAGTAITCANSGTLNLVADITGDAGGTYAWSGTGVLVPPLNANNVDVTSSGTFTLTYRHSVTGCPTTANIIVTDETAAPTVSIDAGPYQIACANVSAKVAITPTLTATGDADVGTTYLWTGPAGAVYSDNTALSTTVDRAGTYTLTATNPEGCTASDNISVTLNTSTPDISVTSPATTKITCTNTTVTLDGGSSTGGATFAWSGTGGASITNVNDEDPVVDMAGTYTLTVTNPANGCTATDDVLVQEDVTNPTASITNVDAENTDLTCTNGAVDLEASSNVANASFAWSTGSGVFTTSGGYNQFAEVTAAANYSVIATNPTNGCTSVAATLTIDEDNEIATSTTILGGPYVLTCSNNGQVTLNGETTEAGGGTGTYAWTAAAGGNIVGASNTEDVVVDAAGDYTMRYYHSVTGCMTSAFISVTDNRVYPTIAIDAGPYVLTCANPTQVLQGNDAPGNVASTTLAWTGPAGATILNDNTLTPEVDKVGTYTITATSLNGCASDASVNVTQDKDQPDITVYAANDFSCSIANPVIKGESTDAVSYLWTVQAGTATIDNNTAAETFVDGAGTFRLTVTGANGCTNFDDVVVGSNFAVPGLNIASDPAANKLTCDVSTVQVVATTGVAGSTYNWSTAVVGASISNPTAAAPFVDKPGLYTVVARHPVSGCTETDNVTVNEDKTTPNISITSIETELTCTVTSIEIDASATTDADTYTWTKTVGGNIASGQGTNKIIVDAPGTYTLTAEWSATGCTSTATYTITEDIRTPDISVNAGTYSISCSDVTETIGATGDIEGTTTYSWSGLGIVGVNTGLNITVDDAGDYTVVATAANGCTNNDVVTVFDNRITPDVSVNAASDITCTNTTSTISGSSPTAISYQWTRLSGTGNIDSPTSPTTTVDGPGTFRLMVENIHGCTAHDDVVVEETVTSPGLTVTSPAANTINCNNPSVQVEANATEANVEFLWSTAVAGATISNTSVANPYVDKAGVYNVIATHPISRCTQTASVTVNNSFTKPTINIVPEATVITCDQPTIKLNATTSTNVDASTYSWVATNGGSITSGATSSIATVNKAGTYTLTAQHPVTGCEASGVVNITSNLTPPNVNITGAPYTLTCSDPTLVLSATADAGASVEWTGPGSIIDDKTLNPTIDTSGTFIITATAANGCTSTDNVLVEPDLDIPDITVDGNPDDITCDSTTVEIVGTSKTPNVSFKWEVISGSATITNSTNSIATVNDQGDFRLTVTAQNGCKNTDEVTVAIDTISPQLSLPAIDDEELTCYNSTVTLNASSTTPGVLYSWTTTVSGATITNGNSPTPTVDKTGSYTVVVTKPGNGCSKTKTTEVQSDLRTPTINIAAVVDEITCTNKTIQLDASSSVDAINYSWQSSNGGHILANPNTAQPTVDAAGRYTVTAEHNVTGCTASDFVDVNQDNSIPTIDVFEPYPDELNCNVTSVQLLADATALTTNKDILWETTDGNFTSATDITNPTVNQPGTYVVTITNTDNTCGTVRSVTVDQNITPPSAQITDPQKITCSRTEVSLFVKASSVDGSNLSYAWTAGAGGNIVSGQNTSNPTVDAVADYNLVVTDEGNHCTTNASVSVDDNVELPPISVDATPDNITCASPQVQLSGSSSYANVAYEWITSGPGSILNASTETPVVNAAGTYNLVVENLDNHCKDTSIDVIVAEDVVYPSVTVNAPSGEITCSVGEVTISVTENADYNYLWSGPGAISSPASYTTTVDEAGEYTVKVTDIDNGCVSNFSTDVIENTTPPASPIISNISTCYGTANPAFNVTSGTNVKWYNDPSLSIYLGAGNNYTPTVTDPGNYKFYATSTGANGCTSLATEVIFTINALPSNPVTYGNQICEGSANVAINAVGSTIKWYDDTHAFIQASANYTPTVNAAGTYTYYATQTDKFGCESEQESATYIINSIPVEPSLVDNVLEVCKGSENPEFTAVGSSIKWYKNLAGAVISNENAYQPDAVLAGTYNYYATQTENGCESPEITATLTINPLPVKYTVQGGGAFCESGAGVEVTLTGSENNINYKLWLDETTLITDVSGTGNALSFGNVTDEGNYTVYGYNTTTSCRLKMIGGVTVTENPLPGNAGSISGPTSVCQGETGLVYTISAINNAVDYHWTAPTGFTITSGANSRTITVAVADDATNGDFTVYASNNCGQGEAAPLYSVNVNPLPGDAVTLSGPSTVCVNQKGVDYSVDAIPNATTYVWSIPVGANIVSGQGTRQITVDFNESAISDDISVYGQNDCGSGASVATAVTVNELPEVDAGNEINICGNATTLSGSAVPTGGSGLWTLYDGAVTIANPAQPNSQLTAIGRGQNKMVWTITSGNGCVNSDTVDVYNNTVFVNAGADKIVCADSTTFNAMAPLQGAYWSPVAGFGSGSVAEGTQPNSKVYNLDQDENVFAWVVENRGCISSDTVSLFNYLPEPPSAGVDQVNEADEAVMDAVEPEEGTVGTWTIRSGSGTFVEPHNPKTQVTDIGPGTNIFVWTVQREDYCTLSDEIVVENTMLEDPEAGVNQVICKNTAELSAIKPSVGVGEWSVLRGAGTFEDKYDNETTVSNLAPGENWFLWSVSTSYQTVESDSVLIHNKKATDANAGLDITTCENNVQLSANTPIYGNGTWTLISGKGDILDDIDPESAFENIGQGENTLKWTINNDFCYSVDFVTITNNTPTQAHAGEDRTVCYDSVQLYPNTPTIGTATWSRLSGAGTFVGNAVINLSPDTSIFRYTITMGSCKSSDDVMVVNNKPTVPQAGYDQYICADSVLLDANKALQGSGVWTTLSGSGTFSDVNVEDPWVTDISDGVNIYRWTITKNGCELFDEVQVSNDFVESYAGQDVILCEDNFQLLASNPNPGQGFWSVVGTSGAIFDDQNDPNTMVRNLSNDENTLRWTVRNGTCEDYDEVVVANHKPTAAFAGDNQAVCGKDVSLNANVPGYGTGLWTVMSGSGSFDDAAEPKTSINNLGVGKNVLRWTITAEECVSYDEVIITSNLPTNVFAGNDQNACSDTAILRANPVNIGAGQWSILKGGGTFESPTTNETVIRDLVQGENIIKWTVSSSDCHVTDTVIIVSTIPTVAVAGADQVICTDSLALSANTPIIGTGEWSIAGGSSEIDPDEINSPRAIARNIARGTSKLRWTISKNGCQSSDDIIITNNQPSAPFAGQDIDICGDSTRLYAEPPTIGTGRWSLISGDAVILSPEENQTRVGSITFGPNTFRWTVTNKNCVLHDDVVITSNLEYVNAGVDVNVNESNVQLVGNKPSTGAGLWSKTAGTGNIVNPANFETRVTNLGSGANVFTWTITNNGCPSSDEVVVNYIVMPVADFAPSALRGCPPLEVNFVNTSIGGEPYSWDFGDGNTTTDHSPTHVYSVPGTYEAELTTTAPLGMTVTKDTLITVYPLPTADFDVAPKTIYVPGQHLSCFNYSTGAESSIWKFGDGNTVDDYAPSYTYEETGLYDITLVVYSDKGCADSTTMLDAVQVEPRSDFFFPDAFTPSPSGGTGGVYDPQDRSNDVFYPIVVDGELLEYDMRIYNRIGVMVFQTNDINTGWDGWYKNKMLPQDVYVFIVTGKYNSGQPFKKTGNVLLLEQDK